MVLLADVLTRVRVRLTTDGLRISASRRCYAQGALTARSNHLRKRTFDIARGLGAIAVGYVAHDVYKKYTIERDFDQFVANGCLDEYIAKGHFDEYITKRQFGGRVQPLSSTAPLGSVQPPQHDTSYENMNAARRELEALLGKDAIDDSPTSLKARSSTAWSKSPTDSTASLLVFPQSTEHVSEVMKICHRRRVPVTGYSGGTSLDGALAATRGGICVDFSRMNKVLAVHERDLDVVVQSAVGWQELNELLSPLDLFFLLILAQVRRSVA